MAGDEARIASAAQRLGYAVGDEGSEYRAIILELFQLALEPLQCSGPYDFAASDMARNIAALGEEVSSFRDFWQVPPTDSVYYHRKLGGMFMLATRLKARVDLNRLVTRWL